MLALFGAVTVVHHIRKKQFKKILTIPVIMIIIGAVGIGAGYLVQNFIVSPDEINKGSSVSGEKYRVHPVRVPA